MASDTNLAAVKARAHEVKSIGMSLLCKKNFAV